MTAIKHALLKKHAKNFVLKRLDEDCCKPETRYRGVRTVKSDGPGEEIHGTFTYRGRTYTK